MFPMQWAAVEMFSAMAEGPRWVKVNFASDIAADGKGKMSQRIEKMFVKSPKQRNSAEFSVSIAGKIVLLRYTFELS